MSRRIWDISQKVQPGIPVWPGDTAYQEDRTWAIGPGCPVNVSRLTLSTHTGTHADAPLHYDADGAGIGALNLEVYLGPAQVVTVLPAAGLVTVEHVVPVLRAGITRVLLHTFARFPDGWVSDFTAIDAGLITALAERGVRLIGTDAPSVDPQDSKTLDAHHAVRRHDMRILEGLVLDGVPDGVYELIALPIRLEGADAAPVRAVLREM
ncbi:kynurenine formamidase [alpha proteobacterium AAP38]|nr:kynurenine formamidase [alpha proteobacterium AAP38]